MKIKIGIVTNKALIAFCGFAFGGAHLAMAQETSSPLVNRIQSVQSELSTTATPPTASGLLKAEDSYWGNEVGSGWANAWCGPYWGNASDSDNGWANAWANC